MRRDKEGAMDIGKVLGLRLGVTEGRCDGSKVECICVGCNVSLISVGVSVGTRVSCAVDGDIEVATVGTAAVGSNEVGVIDGCWVGSDMDGTIVGPEVPLIIVGEVIETWFGSIDGISDSGAADGC